MKKIIFPALLITLSLLTSCSKELITPINRDNVPVVESYLYAGDSIITVKVTKILPFSTDVTEATEYISGLYLQINGAGMTETGTGIYTLQLGDKRIEPGESYTLKFVYASDTVSSTTVIPDKPLNYSLSSSLIYTDRITSSGTGMPSAPPADLTLSWENADVGYYYGVIQYMESSRDYINYVSQSLDLSDTTGISPTNASQARLGIQNFYFFGRYRVILFKVNDAFADLYAQTSLNSNSIASPVTSIQNGFGVFTGMASDTVYLQVREN